VLLLGIEKKSLQKMKAASLFVVVFALFSCLLSSSIVSAADAITIETLDRIVDLQSFLARTQLTIKFKNTGSGSVATVDIPVVDSLAKHLSLFDAFETSGVHLKATSTKDNTRHTVTLSSPLKAQSAVTIKVILVFTHTMTPFPVSIAQNEKQLVLYDLDYPTVLSAYPVEIQTTTVKLASTKIESKTDYPPTSVKGDTITYGPYKDVAPMTKSTPMKIHFENNRPFLTVTSLVKEFEVSHWGNVAVEETFEMQHDGARLKGTFSRYDYQRNPGAAVASIAQFRHYLPSTAADIYYRDEIGNISTSHVSTHERGIALDIIPRYPLFGGWKAAFYMGYNLPLSSFVSTSNEESGLYVLNVTFGVSIDHIAIDHETVRIILPEGATDISYQAPFPVDKTSTATHFTYLDTFGRPVFILEKSNLVDAHDRYFQITYRFSQLAMLREPLLLVAAFFIFAVFVMVYVRIEFTIGEKTKSS